MGFTMQTSPIIRPSVLSMPSPLRDPFVAALGSEPCAMMSALPRFMGLRFKLASVPEHVFSTNGKSVAPQASDNER